jgi:hypothetical protein
MTIIIEIIGITIAMGLIITSSQCYATMQQRNSHADCLPPGRNTTDRHGRVHKMLFSHATA